MRTPRPRPGVPRWPRRTARLRLTVLYGAAFLACGAAVLALTYLLYRPTAHVQVNQITRLKVPVAAPVVTAQQLSAVLLAAARAADIDRLFQPFQRLGPRPARRDGGHGLGLSIVRAIAVAHAAIITAQPRPGGGLAIDVTFPPPAPPQPR